MTDDDAKTLEELRWLGQAGPDCDDETGGGSQIDAAVALIERQAAEIEGLKAIREERGKNLYRDSQANRELSMHLEGCRKSQSHLLALTNGQAREIERLTPKPMTRAEALNVLRHHEYRGTYRWGEKSVGVSRWAEFELFAAAEKLLRDGAPIAEREEDARADRLPFRASRPGRRIGQVGPPRRRGRAPRGGRPH